MSRTGKTRKNKIGLERKEGIRKKKNMKDIVGQKRTNSKEKIGQKRIGRIEYDRNE